MSHRLVIFDDIEVQARQLLERVEQLPRIAELDSEVVCDLTELRSLLLAAEVDILMMDIRIDNARTDGIEFVRRNLPAQSPTQVIFVTSYDTYHASAYRATHMGFLMKPVRQDELEEAVDAAIANLNSYAERPFLVSVPTGDKVVLPRRLRYAESDRHKLVLHVGDEVIETVGKLSDFIPKLPDRFVQCHKSYVVNMGLIDEFGRSDLRLTTGELVPVSQRRRTAVREEFFRFIGRGLAEGASGIGSES